jgi:hypothetical protein
VFPWLKVSPIGVEQTATGYEVAWKDTATGIYTVWNTDSTGNVVSDTIGHVTGTSPALESLEPSFHQDLNGDGVIGPPAATSAGPISKVAAAMVASSDAFSFRADLGGAVIANENRVDTSELTGFLPVQQSNRVGDAIK